MTIIIREQETPTAVLAITTEPGRAYTLRETDRDGQHPRTWIYPTEQAARRAMNRRISRERNQ